MARAVASKHPSSLQLRCARSLLAGRSRLPTKTQFLRSLSYASSLSIISKTNLRSAALRENKSSVAERVSVPPLTSETDFEVPPGSTGGITGGGVGGIFAARTRVVVCLGRRALPAVPFWGRMKADNPVNPDSRYIPGEVIGTETVQVTGSPDPKHISTSCGAPESHHAHVDAAFYPPHQCIFKEASEP